VTINVSSANRNNLKIETDSLAKHVGPINKDN
jgi:hypothetical protein